MENSDQKDITKGLGQAAEKALEFIEKIIANPIMEFTGAITDKIQFWRFKNRVDTVLKAQEFLRSKGIIPKKLPIKDVSNLLELCSYEDNESMQTRWASLLANALDPNNRFDICSIFSQILSQLSSHEVAIIDYMFSRCFWKSDKDRPYIGRIEILRKQFTEYEVTLLIFDNLLRLRLIEEEPPKVVYDQEDDYDIDDDLPNKSVRDIKPGSAVRLSEFGVEFVRKTKYE